MSETTYQRADALFAAGKFSAAATLFKVAIDERPDDWMAMWALADCLSALKKHAQAEHWYASALSLAPPEDAPNLQYNLGNVMFDQGRYAEAIDLYRAVSTSHRVWRSAKLNIGRAEQRMNGTRKHLPRDRSGIRKYGRRSR